MNKISKKYDLEERTRKFGEKIIRFCKNTPQNVITKPLINQLVKAGTSVGANYCEADNAVSRNDFQYKISICKKEAKESQHFINILAIAIEENKDLKVEAKILWQEAKELRLIFNKIYNNLKKK